MKLSTFGVAVWLVLVGVSASRLATAGVAFPEEPGDGWDYLFDGDNDTFGTSEVTLDGTWRRNGASQWDGSAPGEADKPPGGVDAVIDVVDGETTLLRMQDPGNPKDHDIPDPSNRKVYFAHNLNQEDPELDMAVLDNGVTISFRARIPTPDIATLDDYYPSADVGGGPAVPWPEDGLGYVIHSGGRANFGVLQKKGFASGQVGFSLANTEAMKRFAPDFGQDPPSGLVMGTNDTNGATEETLTILPISDEDLNDWREFWITIVEAPDSTEGTHRVDVFMDGSGQRNSFFVDQGTTGNVEFRDGAFIAMGLSSGQFGGAIDVDFFAYKQGFYYPGPLGDMDIDGDVDFDDIGPFVLGLTDPEVYDSTMGVVPEMRGDMDQDGDLDFDDIALFVDALGGGSQAASQAVPEPTSLALCWSLFVGLAVLARSRRRW